MARDDKPYAVGGNVPSEQAEASTANRAAAPSPSALCRTSGAHDVVAPGAQTTEDLVKLRQDVSDSIT